MEHGRLKIKVSSVSHTENFYIAPNSEGLRFSPEWHFYGWGDWDINVPLWAPLLLCLVWAADAWRGERMPGACRCGYQLEGLAAQGRCPECGRMQK
jgi:hypothetical protein